jgi:hypothetical protein
MQDELNWGEESAPTENRFAEELCNIHRFMSFNRRNSIPPLRKRLDRSVLPQSIQAPA